MVQNQARCARLAASRPCKGGSITSFVWTRFQPPTLVCFPRAHTHMLIYMHICTHACTHAHAHTHMHTLVHTCTQDAYNFAAWTPSVSSRHVQKCAAVTITCSLGAPSRRLRLRRRLLREPCPCRLLRRRLRLRNARSVKHSAGALQQKVWNVFRIYRLLCLLTTILLTTLCWVVWDTSVTSLRVSISRWKGARTKKLAAHLSSRTSMTVPSSEVYILYTYIDIYFVLINCAHVLARSHIYAHTLSLPLSWSINTGISSIFYTLYYTLVLLFIILVSILYTLLVCSHL
jgi:hypothetical protein